MLKCVMSNHAIIVILKKRRKNNFGLEMIFKWQEVRAS